MFNLPCNNSSAAGGVAGVAGGAIGDIASGAADGVAGGAIGDGNDQLFAPILI